MQELVLVGGGEHALVVAEAVMETRAWQIAGFFDPQPCEGLTQLGIPRLGDDEAGRLWAQARPAAWFVLGLGADTALRQRLVQRYGDVRWATVVHPRAWVSPSAHLAPGTTVMAGVMINANCRIEAHAILNTGAIVEHDVHVGAFAHVAPGSVVGGGARIGREATLGLGCRVRDHVTIGASAIVAMGAVVVADVSPGARVQGVPARQVSGGWG